MRMIELPNAVTRYKGLELRTRAYRATPSCKATLRDDGYVDIVAVRRVVSSSRGNARISTRELLCIVYEAHLIKMHRDELAEKIGCTVPRLNELCNRFGLPLLPMTYTEKYLAELILGQQNRSAAREDALIQAGVIAA